MKKSTTLQLHHERAQEVAWLLKDALPNSQEFNDLALANHSPIVQAVLERHAALDDPAELWFSATAWWVDQFAATELAALVLATELLTNAEGWSELKHNLADQVGDEARHYEIFLELGLQLPAQPGTKWLHQFQGVVASSCDWRLRHLALSLVLESQALGNLRKLRTDVSFPRAAWAARLILADEARHVNVGRVVATSWVKEASPPERRFAQEWIVSLLQICGDRYVEGPILTSGEPLNLSETSFARELVHSGNARVLQGLKTIGLVDDSVSDKWEQLLRIGDIT